MSLAAAAIAQEYVLVNPTASSNGFGLRYLWGNGSQAIADTGTNCCGGMDFGSGILANLGGTRFFQIQAYCEQAMCDPVSGQILDAKNITLEALDNTNPTIALDESTPNIAGTVGRWVRGTWNASFSAEAQDGVCNASVELDSSSVASIVPETPDTSSWTQCGTGAGTLGGSGEQSVTTLLDTTTYSNGSHTLGFDASDAASPANTTGQSYAVNIDNEPISLAISGPTEVDSGTSAVVDVDATVGPSGADISCSIDGGPYGAYSGNDPTVTVSGLGQHEVSCDAHNNAVDQGGQTISAQPVTWNVAIRNPTVSVVSLAHIADALQCKRRTEHIRVPARWVTEVYHGHAVRVRIPAQRRTVSVVHCSPHIEVLHVHRGGKTIVERVIELPHSVTGLQERVPFGRMTKVSGWLAGTNGVPIANQSIEILTAPADGSQPFSGANAAKTNADGSWSAWIGAGPSQLIEADYAGSADLAPSTSAVATTTVPASPTVTVSPTRTRWGHRITISGQLRGGYIPASGELVVLKIGWKGGSAEIGHVYTDVTGAFHTTYTFLRGTGSEKYRIWAQTARESDYPYAPATSRNVPIHVT